MPKRQTQAEKDERKRAYLDRQQRAMLHSVFDELNEANTARLKRIDVDEWNEARDESLQTEIDDDDSSFFYVVNSQSWTAPQFVTLEFFGMNELVFANDVDFIGDGKTGRLVVNRRNWRTVFDEMTRVQKLVHLAKRYAVDETATVKAAIQRMTRRAYEAELTIQASHVACNRQGHLTNEFIMADLETDARDSSENITNTYNYDLAIAIQKISQQNRFANRHYYAKYLGIWETARDHWKIPQIQQYETGKARAQAMKDFYERNRDIIGIAALLPKTAVCPICQGWIARGTVPIRVAMNNPPPYHIGCPHRWHTTPDRVAKEACRDLWMGGD